MAHVRDCGKSNLPPKTTAKSTPKPQGSRKGESKTVKSVKKSAKSAVKAIKNAGNKAVETYLNSGDKIKEIPRVLANPTTLVIADMLSGQNNATKTNNNNVIGIILQTRKL